MSPFAGAEETRFLVAELHGRRFGKDGVAIFGDEVCGAVGAVDVEGVAVGGEGPEAGVVPGMERGGGDIFTETWKSPLHQKAVTLDGGNGHDTPWGVYDGGVGGQNSRHQNERFHR